MNPPQLPHTNQPDKITRMTNFMLTGLTRTAAVISAARPVYLRGQGRPDAIVTAKLGPSLAQSTRVTSHGLWSIYLPALPVGGPYAGVVESDGQSIPLTDIHAGEVWLCAGQSNMQMPLSSLVPSERPTPGSYPLIRTLVTGRKLSISPLPDVSENWVIADRTPTAVSAVGFHFARTIHHQLSVPVGIVQSAVGHTPAMAWTPRESTFKNTPAADLLARFDEQAQAHPGAKDSLDPYFAALQPGYNRWNKAITAWQAESRKLKAAGQPLAPMPSRETGFADPHTPTLLFNGMISPYIGEHFSGVLWYQGETDAILGYADEYQKSLTTLISAWRKHFGEKLPFVIVQLPRHDDIQCQAPDDQWAKVRQAQASMVSDTNIGLVQTLDLGDTVQIHPTRKKTLAERAAAVALHLAYGHAGHRHGPMLFHHKTIGEKTRLTFGNVTGRLSWAGSQNPNSAQIQTTTDNINWTAKRPSSVQDDSIEIDTSPDTKSIRYAWACDPSPSLFDSAGLPVSGFCVTTEI